MSFFKKSVLPLFILWFGASCAPGPSVQRPAAPPEAPRQEQAKPVSAEPAPSATPLTPPSVTLIYVPHQQGDPAKIIETLSAYPSLRLTLLFPTRYFEQAERKPMIEKFRVLQSSGQIEIGLTLDNEPVLPLLANLKIAGEKVQGWGFNFSWPEDVAYSLARGSARYQKRWGNLPSGFFPPYGSLSEPVIDSLQRFRLNWAAGGGNSTWGVRFFGALALLIPDNPPSMPDTVGTHSWGEKMAAWTFERPFVVIDASTWADPNAESVFLEEFAVFHLDQKEIPLMTAKEFTESLGDEYTLPKTVDPFDYDLSAWVSTNHQKRAWQALAEARAVLDTYQNSGRANLQRLDAATEEMAAAENGSFMLTLGQTQTRSEPSERNFLATLANVYRLCGVPIPANLNNLLAERSIQKALIKPAENDRPFFVEGAQSLTWNDPAGDDVGGSTFVYPAGRYPKGSFDLRDVTISWDDSEVTISATLVAMPPLATSAIVPLVDVYIDINKLSGAGSTSSLRKRSATLIDKEAAWEYAVSLSPLNAVLFQSVPGGDPRPLKTQRPETDPISFSAAFSRQYLRGDPRNWRLSVGLMGTENGRKTEDLIPVSILTTAGERNFGGAFAGRSVPPFIDILAPTADDQKKTISVYEAGAKITLPFVEAE